MSAGAREPASRAVRHRSPFLRLWGWPIALAALSLFGLLAALLGQGGIWWLLSWITLTIPLVVIVVHLMTRPA